MQPFRIRKDAREWFQPLRQSGAMSLDFDPFYFCFVAGVAKGRKRDSSGEETAELVPYFPGKYRPRGKLLVGLFLNQELAVLGLAMEERASVHSAIAGLVRPDSPNHLTEAGVKEFNKYAHGGFDVLLDWFEEKPRSLDYFVRAFKRQMDQALGGDVGASAVDRAE